MINESAIKKLITEAGQAAIVAATKTQTAADINSLKNYGITKAGENRVQELLEKYDYVAGIEWHFIGRLQTNKVKYVVDKVKMIQSVDRLALALEIEKQCAKKDLVMDVLLELNAGEESKGGANEKELFALAAEVTGLKHLHLKGLMCVPPEGAKEEVYKKIHQIYLKLKEQHEGIDHLSVGMSGDYQTALKFGSNMIRTGSLIFGKRESKEV